MPRKQGGRADSITGALEITEQAEKQEIFVMTTEKAVQPYNMRRGCKDRKYTGSTAAVNDGLFLTQFLKQELVILFVTFCLIQFSRWILELFARFFFLFIMVSP